MLSEIISNILKNTYFHHI